MWFWKDKLKAKYRALAYQRIFLVGFIGMACWWSFLISLFLPFWLFSPEFWLKAPFGFLAIPLEKYFGTLSIFTFWIRITFSVVFSAAGVTLVIRSLQTFGADYMSVVYLYFPEESSVQHHKIYSVIRHPTYAGFLLLGLGGMFFTFTLYSIIFYLTFLAGFYLHARCVEEKELIARFGSAYQKYMKKVPAFFVKPNQASILLSFLIKGEAKKIKNHRSLASIKKH